MKKIAWAMLGATVFMGCVRCSQPKEKNDEEFKYVVEQFADLEILRYKVIDFDSLTLNQKQLVYHLSQAAIMGRDILFDQNGKYNLAIRRTLESIYTNYKGDRSTDDFKSFEVYLKRIWFSNGIHHHYAEDKILPNFSKEFFREALKSVPKEELQLPVTISAEAADVYKEMADFLEPIMFDPNIMSKRTVQSGVDDVILASANNYYGDGVTQKEAERFYDAMQDPKDETPISYGLNSRLVKENGKLTERVWKIGGLYTEALEKIVSELELAMQFTENDHQCAVIEKLIEFYRSGNLEDYDAYSILWVKDLESKVDFVNGFTETYGDPLDFKGSWESLVNFKNTKASGRTALISDSAQWFEDHSPIDPRFKKEKVKGVSAKVITAAMLGGDCYPATPIGVNLPNANWIRLHHGSKSVTIENITEAYDKASIGNGFGEEFIWSDVERSLIEKYGFLTDNLHTDMHECLGHASGKLLPGVSGGALKNYASVLEEARADLFALYYLGDAKMLELGLLTDPEAYKAEYYKYIMNGMMTQLVRIELGKDVEEAHMRNRQLIAHWAYEHGKKDNVIELRERDGKHYVVVNDYEKLRNLFGELLAEMQRLKSEGDYEAGKELVETYGVKIDLDLHKEVLARYEKLNLAPYRGFVNPVYHLVKDASGKVIDVKVDYTEGYAEQMLRYAKDYSFLPTYNL